MHVNALTEREFEVLRTLAQGLSSKEVADRMNISVKTIESHREHIKRKLGMQDGAVHHFMRFALEHGILSFPVKPEMAPMLEMTIEQQWVHLNQVLTMRELNAQGFRVTLPAAPKPVYGCSAKA